MHNGFRILALAASVAALTLVFGCSTPAPPPLQPAFYADLAQPGAALDPVSASEIINAYRQRNGLAPALWDASLQKLAEQEARALADRGDLSDGGGGAMLRALSAAGYAPQDIRRSVSGGYHSFADAFSGWRGSPGHDGVLRARDGKRYAIAAVAKPGSRHRVYWVMLVSTR